MHASVFSVQKGILSYRVSPINTFTLRSLAFHLTVVPIFSSFFPHAFSKVQLALGTHPDGLICTLYMQILQSTYIDLLERLIEDNRNNSILFIYANSKRPIPPPSVHFQEQCTFSFVVGDVYTLNYVDWCAHSLRPSLHSSFVIITKINCAKVRVDRKFIDKGSRSPLIYFYFFRCEKSSQSLFPNAYINPFNSFDGAYKLTFLNNRNTFSVYSFEPLINKNQYNQYFFLSLNEDVHKTFKAEYPVLIKKYCKSLVYAVNKRTFISMCNAYSQFVKLLLIQFNWTLITDSSLTYRSTGLLHHNVFINEDFTIVGFYYVIKLIHISDDISFFFVYCKPNNQSSSFTVAVFTSPFNLFMWILICVTLGLLIFVGIYPKRIKTKTERLWYNFRLIFEQDIEVQNTAGFLVLISFCVICSTYKTVFTSDIIVPSTVKPTNNLSILIRNGYTYWFDDSTWNVIDRIKRYLFHSITIPNSTFSYSKFRLKDFRQPTVKLFTKKAVFLTSVTNKEVISQINTLETLLGSSKCFRISKPLTQQWRSYLFFHPLYERLKAFSRSIFENGVFNLLEDIDANLKSIILHTRKMSTEEKHSYNIAKEDALFINFSQTWPIFVMCFIFVAVATVALVTENHNINLFSILLILKEKIMAYAYHYIKIQNIAKYKGGFKKLVKL